MAEEQKRTAPYGPFSTLLTGLDALQQGLPEVLDKSVWRTLSGAAQSQLIGAFRFFDLIDEQNRVQPTLRQLVQDRDNRKTILRGLLEEAYPEAVALGRNMGTLPQLNQTMEAYGVKGDTVSKAVTFFIKAAEYAELTVSPHWKYAVRKRNGGTSRKARPRRGVNGTKADDAVEETEERDDGGKPAQLIAKGITETVSLRSGGTVWVGYDLNLFELDDEDRQFLLEGVRWLKSYKAKLPGGDASRLEAMSSGGVT